MTEITNRLSAPKKRPEITNELPKRNVPTKKPASTSSRTSNRQVSFPKAPVTAPKAAAEVKKSPTVKTMKTMKTMKKVEILKVANATEAEDSYSVDSGHGILNIEAADVIPEAPDAESEVYSEDVE